MDECIQKMLLVNEQVCPNIQHMPVPSLLVDRLLNSKHNHHHQCSMQLSLS